LEIRLGGAPLAVVMRTPGHDEELAFGFALTEGLVPHASELLRAVHCSQGEHGDNVISLIPKPSLSVDPRKFQRNFYTTSSCGICGKQSLEQALKLAPPIQSPVSFDVEVLRLAPKKLTEHQEAYAHCGALHGAGLFNTEGEILCVREDVGRHNAVDKVVGWAARNQTELSSLALVISGRASFEIIQKALFARLSCVVAVGGASSLAVELAKQSKITLIGFAREARMSIYSGMGTAL
jgi:FdhD protein